MKTKPGQKLLQAFLDYGAYIVDDTGAGNTAAICMEAGVNSEMRNSFGFAMTYPHGVTKNANDPGHQLYADLLLMFQNLHVVVNNDRFNIGGGGRPRIPTKGPICPDKPATLSRSRSRSKSKSVYQYHPNNTSPEQLHLALGRHVSETTVQWAMTAAPSSLPVHSQVFVQYWQAIKNTATTTIRGSITPFPVPITWQVTGHFIHANISRTMSVCRATMTHLSPKTQYTYRVGSNTTGWSNHFTFTSQSLASMLPIRIGVLGDFGDTNGRSFPQLTTEVHNRQLEAIIHLGDIAYDLDTRQDEIINIETDETTPVDGATGDRFMRDLEPIAASVPYLVLPGNHEFNFNTTAFTHRFNGMPSNSPSIPSEAGDNVANHSNNWWYSYNIGPAHFISLNSNVVTDPTVVTNTSRYHWNYPVSVQRKQFEWLQQDLIRAAANRTRAPFIIMMAHFPMYCSSTAPGCTSEAELMRNGIPQAHELAWEPLMKEYQVDLYLSAHMHCYERFYPTYNGSSNVEKWSKTPHRIVNAKLPVHIVQGAAGNVEGQSGFDKVTAKSAYRSMQYGYSGLTLHNVTHLEWTFILTDNSTDDGDVVDRMWLVKE